MIAGVCAGVANYFDIDPTVVRIAWAFLVVLFGSGLLLYLICWLLMLTTSSYGLNAVVRGKREGTLSGRAAVVLGILHLFFVADVIGAVILLIRLRKRKKLS